MSVKQPAESINAAVYVVFMGGDTKGLYAFVFDMLVAGNHVIILPAGCTFIRTLSFIQTNTGLVTAEAVNGLKTVIKLLSNTGQLSELFALAKYKVVLVGLAITVSHVAHDKVAAGDHDNVSL